MSISHKQQKLYTCQSCHKMVEKIYQQDYCKPCLVDIFNSLNPILKGIRNLSDTVSKMEYNKAIY